MTGTTARIPGVLMAMFFISTTVSHGLPTPGGAPPMEVENRLEALVPEDPRGYFELGEDLADRDSEEERRLARRLFGLAGRIDPEKYGASAALALAELASDVRTRTRLKAAATMLPGGSPLVVGLGRGTTDGETAFKVSEAFGDFRSGRMNRLRRLLADPVVRNLLEASNDFLPGGILWLEDTVENARQLPELSQEDQLALLRFELMLLEGGRPSWSTLLAVEADPPLLEIDAEGLDRLLLDEETLRPLRREGRWVAR